MLTVGQLLAGERLSYPHVEGMDGTFKRAPRALMGAEPQPELPLGGRGHPLGSADTVAERTRARRFPRRRASSRPWSVRPASPLRRRGTGRVRREGVRGNRVPCGVQRGRRPVRRKFAVLPKRQKTKAAGGDAHPPPTATPGQVAG